MKTAMEYIFDAQDLLDLGKIQACQEILNQAKQARVEPALIIEKACKNLLKGEKKLLADSSVSRKSSPRKGKFFAVNTKRQIWARLRPMVIFPNLTNLCMERSSLQNFTITFFPNRTLL